MEGCGGVLLASPRVSLPQLFYALTPILFGLGTLLWLAVGLPLWGALLAGLGMGLLPVAIVAALAWQEKKRGS